MGLVDDKAYSLIQDSDGKLVLAGDSWNGSNLDFSLIRLNPDGSLDTSFGKLVNKLGSAATYVEGGSPVVLSRGAQIHDAELAALNNGAGDYAGASLTVKRQGGANADDQFGVDITGSGFTISGNSPQSNGQTFATFTSSGGTLIFDFTGNSVATQALVNEVLSHITYSNSNVTADDTLTMEWTFNDGILDVVGTTKLYLIDVG